jgi:hypothetical protein
MSGPKAFTQKDEEITRMLDHILEMVRHGGVVVDIL